MVSLASHTRGARVLVTGATGFVGSHLVSALVHAGARVTAIIDQIPPGGYFAQDRLLDKVTPVFGTITDLALVRRTLRQHRIETVMHLAAVAVEAEAFAEPYRALEVNIVGTVNILEACRLEMRQIDRIMIASSDKAYGDTEKLPYTEDMPLLGRNPYDASKSCADMLSQTYHRSYGLPIMIGRYANVFGPWDVNWSRLIPGTLRRVFRGEAPILKRPRAGAFTRDFLPIEDALRSYFAMYRAFDDRSLHGQAFNFALAEPRGIADVIQMLLRTAGAPELPPQVVFSDHPEILAQHMCIAKAAERLSWVPEHTFEAALRETTAWYIRYFTEASARALDVA